MSKYLLSCILLVFLIYFITISNISAEPIITDVSPEDGAKLDSNPSLIINISNDLPSNIIWYFKETESEHWEKIGENNSVISGVYQQNIPNGTREGTNYQWKVNISDSNSSIERIYNFRRRGWQQVSDGWFTGGNWSGTYYNRSIVPLYALLEISISELFGRQFNIEWKTNASGQWETFANNLFCFNGTYQQTANWANQSNKIYWWSFVAKSSEGSWSSDIYNFTTEQYTWGPWSNWLVFSLAPKEINIQSFKPINFEDKGLAFDLSLDIIMDGYNGSLVLDISTREINSTIDPNNIGEKDGNYVIRDFQLPTIGNQNAYPFDKYKVKIEFITENGERLNTSNFETELHNIPQWEMQIQWGNNTLNATFSRTQEVYIFILLVLIGLISIVSNFIYIFKSQNSLLSYIGEITSISFIVGGFIDFILNHPTFSSPYIIFFIILLFISIISRGFVYKQKKSEEKEK